MVVAAERVSGYERPSGGHGGSCGAGEDLDHVVPLKEAWESGVDDLSAFNRDRANHFCMPSSANRSKGSSEPHEWGAKPKLSEWLASSRGAECALIQQWARVKTAWAMTADQREHAYMTQALSDCGTGGTAPAADQSGGTSSGGTSSGGTSSGGCEHWHSGHPKHTHPGAGHGHSSGKCAGYESGGTAPPAATPAPERRGGCEHWHSGHPKHTHPGANHGPHGSGKCAGHGR